MKRFSIKDPDERVVLSFEFKRRLGEGVTLSLPTVTPTVASGTDASPGAVVSGAAAVLGSKVLQLVKDGVDQVDYRLKCKVETSDGQRFTLYGRLPVRTQ